MAVKIRCVEGHVFERSLGQCPTCGWKVPSEKPGLGERIRDSLPGIVMNVLPDLNPELTPTAPGAPVAAGSIALQLARSRSILILLCAVGVLTYLFAINTWSIHQIYEGLLFYNYSSTFLYTIVIIILVVLMFGVYKILRADVPVILLIAAFFLETWLMKLPLWNWWYAFWNETLLRWMFWNHNLTANCLTATSPCVTPAPNHIPYPYPLPDNLAWLGSLIGNVVGAGFNEETFKLIPVVAILLIAWVASRLPLKGRPAAIRTRAIAWARLERTTTIMMLAFAAGAGFIVDETLGQYFNVTFNASFAFVHGWTSLLPIVGAPGSSPWAPSLYFGAGAGLKPVFALAIPRTSDIVAGHGAYAAVAAYYLARARTKPLPVAVGLVVLGLGLSGLLHGGWDAFVGAFNGKFEGFLALAAYVLLFAVCAQAVEMDRRAGFVPDLNRIGDSITPDQLIPAFPMGEPPVPEAPPPAGPASPPVTTPKAPPVTPIAAAPLAMLTIDGTTDVPGRRVPLMAGDSKIEPVPGVVFAVAAHPSDPTRFGLTNCGTTAWTLQSPDGAVVDVQPGKTAALVPGGVIDFGVTRGRIDKASAA